MTFKRNYGLEENLPTTGDPARTQADPLGFWPSVLHTATVTSSAYTPWGFAQDLANADAEQSYRLKRDYGIDLSTLNNGDVPVPGFNVRTDDSFVKAMQATGYQSTEDDESRTQAVLDKTFQEQFGASEENIRKLQQENPGAGIKTRQEMTQDIYDKMQVKLQEEQGPHTTLGDLGSFVGGVAATFNPWRDPVSAALNITGFGAAGFGKTALARIGSAAGFNFGASLFNQVTGTDENLRMFGLDPTIGDAVRNAALAAAIPTALVAGGELLRGFAARRMRLERERAPPPPPPPPATETAPAVTPEAFVGPIPESRPYQSARGVDAVLARFPQPLIRARVIKGISAVERQDHYGSSVLDMLPPTIDKNKFLAPLSTLTTPIRERLQAVDRTLSQPVAELNDAWRTHTASLTLDQAARQLDPEVFGIMDRLTARVNALKETQQRLAGERPPVGEIPGKGPVAPPQPPAGPGVLDTRSVTEALIAQKVSQLAKATPKQAEKLRQQIQDIQDIATPGMTDAIKAVKAHEPLVAEALARAQGRWELSTEHRAALTEAVDKAIGRIGPVSRVDLLRVSPATEMIGRTKTAEYLFGLPQQPGRANKLDLSQLQRADANPHETTGRLGVNPETYVKELQSPLATPRKEGETITDVAKRVQTEQRKVLDNDLVKLEGLVTRWLADAEDPVKAGQGITINGENINVHFGSDVGDIFGTGKNYTVKEALQELQESKIFTEKAMSCRI